LAPKKAVRLAKFTFSRKKMALAKKNSPRAILISNIQVAGGEELGLRLAFANWI
jgi:hypothetical protein